MASVRKITSSESLNILFNKPVLSRSNLRQGNAGFRRLLRTARAPANGTVPCRSRPRSLFTFHIIAVSGEIMLHADGLYVQVSQPATGHGSGILFRTCEGREDYAGGANNFASLDLLNQPKELACLIKEKCGV